MKNGCQKILNLNVVTKFVCVCACVRACVCLSVCVCAWEITRKIDHILMIMILCHLATQKTSQMGKISYPD